MHNGENWDSPNDATLAACARRVVRFLGFVWVVAPVTLVGLDSYFTSKSVYEEFRASLLEAATGTVAARRRLPWKSPDTIRGLDLRLRLHILTLGENRERIGDATYVLHTEQ